MWLIAMPWEWLDGKRPNTIYVHPLLLVLLEIMHKTILFGDEEDSVINELADYGYEVKPIHSTW